MVSMFSAGMTYGVNYHQNLRNQYSVGREYHGSRPYSYENPVTFIPRQAAPQYSSNAIVRFFQKYVL